MDLYNSIKTLIKETHNDAELGAKIRKLFNELSESKVKPKNNNPFVGPTPKTSFDWTE